MNLWNIYSFNFSQETLLNFQEDLTMNFPSTNRNRVIFISFLSESISHLCYDAIELLSHLLK